MRKYNILFLDEDEYYLNNLMNYVTQEYSYKIKADSISGPELLAGELGKNPKIDLIVATQEFYEGSLKYLRDKNVVLLANKISDKNNLLSINKYQSIKLICEKVIDICKNSINVNEKETKLITFYSPIGGIGVTTLSLLVAERLVSEGAKVIYISFEDSQSLDLYLNKDKHKYNFSDVILSVKGRSNNFYEILEEAVSSYNNTSFYYLSSVDSILDLEELSIEDLRELIDKIIEKKYYDYLICELPSVFSTKYYHLLKKSNSVVEIIGQDALSAYKVDALLKQFDEIDNFKFLINKYDKNNEMIMPGIISKNLLPIIKTIPYYKSIERASKLSSLRERAREFDECINEVVQYIK